MTHTLNPKIKSLLPVLCLVANLGFAAIGLPCRFEDSDSTTLRRMDDPIEIITGDDNCVLSRVESVANLYAKTGSSLYIDVYRSIATVSDGYVSEALGTNSIKMLRAHPEQILVSLKGSEDAFWVLLVDGISEEISVYGKAERKNKLADISKSLETKVIHNTKARTALKKLFDAVDPTKFD
jgi:hypothetical protein